ncbi:helix-turn-helix domain-containing protein [Streptomyces sp. WAC01280]|uniref:helix-turn-helix domain-containing protein n=1 Tax=Streptomyces sp. WAC01280 TaxID=2487424 RepID=UPI00163C3A89|nr:helix-turn-helix domain-containing protein [Streptomyces sp. WAC01280]
MAARAAEIGPAGRHVGQAVARLREARSWDQAALVAQLAAEGLALSQPILSRVEAGTRRVDVDELLALAAVLGASPLALLPPDATTSPASPSPGSVRGVSAGLAVVDELGEVSAALAEDLEQLGDLTGMEPTLAATAVRLAEQVDGGRPVPCDECGHLVHGLVDARSLPQLTRELRATVAALLEGRTVDDDDDDLGDLGDI